MKRYIVEVDERRIYSYEVSGADSQMQCRLMKYHGEKYCRLEEHTAFWPWFKDEVSQLEGEEIDICFLYSSSASAAYKKVFDSKPAFSPPEKTSWSLAELTVFFHEYRDIPILGEIDYRISPARLVFSDDNTFMISGLQDFHLKNETQYVFRSKNKEAKFEDSSSAKKDDRLALVKEKTKIKVFSPNEQKKPMETLFPAVPKEEKRVQKTKNTSVIPARPEPSEKVTAEDLQRHIARQTAGQCDTVSFRSNQ